MYAWMAARAKAGTTTPFGVPVVPDVKMWIMGTVAPEHGGREACLLTVQQLVEQEVSVPSLGAGPGDDDPPRRVSGDVAAGVELGPLPVVADNRFRVAAIETERDRRWSEGREQGDVDGTEAPDGDHRRHVVDALPHEGGDAVAGTDAKLGKGGRYTLGRLAQLTKRERDRAAVPLHDRERCPVRRVPVAEHLGDAQVGSAVLGQQFVDARRHASSPRSIYAEQMFSRVPSSYA